MFQPCTHPDWNEKSEKEGYGSRSTPSGRKGENEDVSCKLNDDTLKNGRYREEAIRRVARAAQRPAESSEVERNGENEDAEIR